MVDCSTYRLRLQIQRFRPGPGFADGDEVVLTMQARCGVFTLVLSAEIAEKLGTRLKAAAVKANCNVQ